MAIATGPTDPTTGEHGIDRRSFLLGAGALTVVGIGALAIPKAFRLAASALDSQDSDGQSATPEQATFDYFAPGQVPLIEFHEGIYGEAPELPDGASTDVTAIVEASRQAFTYGLNNADADFLAAYVYSDDSSGQELLGDAQVYASELQFDREETNDIGRTEAWVAAEVINPPPLDDSIMSFTVNTREFQYVLPTSGLFAEVYEHNMETTFVRKTIETIDGSIEIWVASYRQETGNGNLLARGENPHLAQ